MPDNTLLIISQVYVPDPAAVGQYMHDAAAAMVKRGFRVVVLTSSRGFDDPAKRYPAREVRDGVQIVRLPLSSFGKSSIASRILGAVSFLGQVVLRGLFTRNLKAILISTSPPMAPAAALFIRLFRRIPIKYWVMDINPDQAIAIAKFAPGSLPVRLFNVMNRRILRKASDVITLDRFMADRLCKKLDVRDKITVIPPWPHVDENEPPIPHSENPFRLKHGLGSKFVVMYSGNFSLVHPINTILEAALRLQNEPDIVFLFVGGGHGKAEIKSFLDRHSPPNIRLLPYQPMENLRYSLAAADVHLVTMGDNMVGIVHPCKVYGALAAGRPLLLVGPDPSHISDIILSHEIGQRVAHGDVDGAVATIRELRYAGQDTLQKMGATARELVRTKLGKNTLRGRFCNLLERGL